MAKVKKFTSANIRKITGGKDPIRLVQEFILRLGFDPETCQKEKTQDAIRWMISLAEDEDLEVLIEGTRNHSETTVYMGINVATVPVRGGAEMLAAALEIADGLVGIKVSLVGHYLVLSATLGASGLSLEEIEYHYKLITAQRSWFREALLDELQWEEIPIE